MKPRNIHILSQTFLGFDYNCPLSTCHLLHCITTSSRPQPRWASEHGAFGNRDIAPLTSLEPNHSFLEDVLQRNHRIRIHGLPYISSSATYRTSHFWPTAASEGHVWRVWHVTRRPRASDGPPRPVGSRHCMFSYIQPSSYS